MAVNELWDFLYSDGVTVDVLKDNKLELSLSVSMLKFTEQNIFKKLNGINPSSEEENTLNKVNILLFVQGVKSFKSGLILSLNGYFTTSIIVARNLVETIFNIKYINEYENERYQKAFNYINNTSKWTDETIKSRAYLSLDSTLYNIYRITSDYTHSNYIATSQNFNESGHLVVNPTNEKIGNSINLLNSVYYYLLEYICTHYKIDFSIIENLEKSQEFEHRLKTYKMFNFSKKYRT